MNNKKHLPLFLLPLLAASCANNEDLVFTTFTKTGVDISAVNNVPVSGTFGYKRFEGAIIPVDVNKNKDAHSVFAAINMENNWLGGIEIKQMFATGDAAVASAKNPNGLTAGLKDEDQGDTPTTQP